MKKHHSRTRFATPLLALALAGAAFAGPTETTTVSKITEPTDWLKVSGYVAMSYTYVDVKGGRNFDTFADSGANNFDSAKVLFTGTFGDLTANVSLFWVPGLNDVAPFRDEAGILDAYLTYTSGPFSITAGKYLSWLGYEAFDAANMTQLTYANTLGAIPGYHSGVKFEYITDAFATGVNISDSIRGDEDFSFFRGDNDFTDGLGYEIYASYKAIEGLTVFGAIAYEEDDVFGDFITYNLWSSYALTDKLTVAAEAAYSDNNVTHGMQYLVYANYAFTDKFSVLGRVGYDNIRSAGAEDNIRYTVASTYKFDDHFALRGEVTYNQNDTPGGDFMFYGVQGLLTF